MLLMINTNRNYTYRKYVFSCEIILEKLASKNPAYYVCTRIEQILRKQRNPTMKHTTQIAGYYFPVCFSSLKSVFKAIKG
jgi:arginyl-tRNA synthetase